jgi:hypothetical protein
MQPSELQVIANNICTIANSKFDEYNNRCLSFKWELQNHEPNQHGTSLESVNDISLQVDFVINAIKESKFYSQLVEYLSNKDCLKIMASVMEKFCFSPEKSNNAKLKLLANKLSS